MYKRRNKKAVSEILSTTLLLVLAVAAAAVAYFWFNKIAISIESSGTDITDAHVSRISRAIRITNPIYDNNSDVLYFTVVNDGMTTLKEIRDITAPGIATTRITIKDKNYYPICSAVKITNSEIPCIYGCGEDLFGHHSRNLALNLTNSSCSLKNHIGEVVSFEMTFEPNGVISIVNFIV